MDCAHLESFIFRGHCGGYFAHLPVRSAGAGKRVFCFSSFGGGTQRLQITLKIFGFLLEVYYWRVAIYICLSIPCYFHTVLIVGGILLDLLAIAYFVAACFMRVRMVFGGVLTVVLLTLSKRREITTTPPPLHRRRKSRKRRLDLIATLSSHHQRLICNVV